MNEEIFFIFVAGMMATIVAFFIGYRPKKFLLFTIGVLIGIWLTRVNLHLFD